MTSTHLQPPSFAAFLLAIFLTSCSVAVEQWRVIEIPFESASGDVAWDEVMDVTFTSGKTGESFIVPAFWDGGNSVKVRFAPPGTGKWSWTTSCSGDRSLSGLSGSFRCGRYSGNLDIYRHGFVTVRKGKKYMTYSDGTPFFYLGDTHWGMYTEEIDEPGPHAGESGALSHFKYLIDKRVAQGFTVYQSEPIGAAFNLADGSLDEKDIEGFRLADRYYQYIADAGLVHANAEFFFANQMHPGLSDRQLESMSRYWVARFGAYPVLWTLAQEVDNDFYSERGDQKFYDYTCNPWVKVAEYIHRYDEYSHPLSAHQESTWFTTVTGYGCRGDKDYISGGGVSAFASEEVAERTGHDWWAVQWSPSLTESPWRAVPEDYLASEYPAVNYEGRYCGLWTKDFGSRAQGWISFLTGFCGYGYGAADIWLYKSTYDMNSVSFDGVDSVTVADKNAPWSVSVGYDSAVQMGYLRDYFESFDWWNLTPVLSGDSAFRPSEGVAWACASTADRTVVYFYGRTSRTGCLAGLAPEAKVSLSWFNPRTGEESSAGDGTVTADGCLILPELPDCGDWVLTCLF